jgi:hypothetical protein
VASAVRALPEHPSLEHLKKQARRRLRALRERAPAARLADAQLQLAREHGFTCWRQLKAFVDQAPGPAASPYANLAGFYAHDERHIANAVVAVVATGGRLAMESVTGARFDLAEEAPGRFVIAGLDGQHMFEGGEAGPAGALLSRGRLGEVRLQRIDEARAEAMRAARDKAKAEQARPRTSIAVRAEVLQRCVGHYAPSVGPSLEVLREDDRLFARVAGQPKLEVFPESERSFFYRVTAAQLEFTPGRGEVTGLVLHQSGLAQRFARVSPEAADASAARIRERLAEQQRPRALAEIDPSALHRFVGRYELDGARTLEVTAVEDRLFVEITGQPKFEVYPESEATFFWTVVAAQISFVSDASGRVSHAVLHQSGRDVPLARLDQERPAPP